MYGRLETNVVETIIEEKTINTVIAIGLVVHKVCDNYGFFEHVTVRGKRGESVVEFILHAVKLK